MSRFSRYLVHFKIPLSVLLGIIVYLVLSFLKYTQASIAVALALTFVGSYKLIKNSLISILKGQLALDYIAILSISIAILTGEYLVALIIALMLASGATLEEYGVSSAKNSLTQLIDRIPNTVSVWENGETNRCENISKIKIGEKILIRKGEVIGLDGIFFSESGLTDESSLTGEPYLIEKIRGDVIRS